MGVDTVSEVKSKLDIVEVVSEYVHLTKKGKNYWGCCPFHSEKTPSFAVSQDHQTYHCFGCGKSGDMFTFVMEHEHLEFREALEKLAERAGVQVVRKGSRKINRDINDAALEFFKNSLAGASGGAARKYLEKRAVSQDNIKCFEIGWSPASWDSMLNYLKNAGFRENEITESGLATKGERGGCFDRFRGRIMFPIRSYTGRVIGFGGRIIDGDGAKYLNSPESSLFNKRHNLYLIDKAKASDMSKNSILLVEGYMDAIRCHICGYTNTVASLGTALTAQQAALIKRLTAKCYVCYDADNAGQEAALRAMYELYAEGVMPLRVVWSGGKDPDEILSGPGGAAVFEQCIKNALPLPLFHAALRKSAIRDPKTAVSARRELIAGLSKISVFDIMPYIDRLSAMLGVEWHELKNMIEHPSGMNAQMPAALQGRSHGDMQCEICSILWSYPTVASQFDIQSIMWLISDVPVQNIIFALANGESREQIERRWQQLGDTSSVRIIAKGNSLLDNDGINEKNALKFLCDFKSRICVSERKDLLYAKIKSNTATDDEYKEYNNLVKLLKIKTKGGI